jgi:hypothetical protein
VKFKPVPDSGDFRCNLGQDEIETIRKQIAADSDCAVGEAMKTAVERIKTAVGHMATKLREYSVGENGVTGKFRDSLVENVRDLCDVLPGLNIAGNKAIDRLIGEMRAELTSVNPDTLRSDNTARVQVADAADAILARMGEYGL